MIRPEDILKEFEKHAKANKMYPFGFGGITEPADDEHVHSFELQLSEDIDGRIWFWGWTGSHNDVEAEHAHFVFGNAIIDDFRGSGQITLKTLATFGEGISHTHDITVINKELALDIDNLEDMRE